MQSTTIDLTNQKYGRLTVIKKGNGRYTRGGQYKTTWVCKCECGTVKEFESARLRSGHTTSCGCLKQDKMSKASRDDLTGQKFNRLTVIRFLEPSERECKTRCWLCRCDCGNEVQVNASKLKTGHTRSCGCLVNEHIGSLNKKYEYSNKRLYAVYAAMVGRCTDPNSKRYHHYGGRGIKVCDSWLNSYDEFAKWAYDNGYDPLAKHGECTLDRIDVNGNYEPNNCRWISNAEQQLNRRNNHLISYNGKTQTVKEWCVELGLPETKVRWHLQKGETLDEIVKFFETKELH